MAEKTPALPDGAARARIREAIDRNLLVEAAAGTGKTTSLVDRMVALVLAGTSVQRICAVTFTIKAAAQLDQKFQSALEAAAREEVDPERRERLANALTHLDACFIGTIHAFCSRLLRERPVEAGLDPGFEELDEAADLAARAESWKRYGERLFTEGSPVLGRLLASGIELEHLRETYDLMCEHGDAVPVLDASGDAAPPDLSPAREPIEAFLERALAAIPPAVPAAGWDRLQSAIRTAGRLRQLTDLRSAPELVAVLKELARPKECKAKSWPGNHKQAGERVMADLDELRASVIEPALRRWKEYLHPIALAAIQPAVDEYRAWRRREARVNFQDQLVFARDLLRDHPAVRSAFQERFTPVLVDEFQDTDPVQAEVLLYLTGRDTEQRDWRKLEPLPGSLFVVGDPKQSIYRFRRADIQTYDTVSTILQKSGGEVLRLSTNFRSTDAVCSWVNGVFERIFPNNATASQAAHVPLHPHRGQDAANDCPAVYRIEVRSSNKPREMAADDAERVADAIASSIRGGPPFGVSRAASPSDFLVLSRRRANLPAYARALEARGVPYEIAGGGAFRDSDEIATLLAALEAIADPENPVPLVATLRGPLFGIDDETLYRFAKAGGRFDFRSRPPARYDARIRRAYDILAEGADFAATLPPAAALSRLVERLGAIALAASGSLGDARAGNIVKALATARELSRQREPFPEIVRRLAELAEQDKVEEMVTRPTRSDVVRLMTLHRAKGLEARVVFLADPTDANPPGPRLWVDRSSDPPRAHVLVEKRTGPFSREEIARPPGWDEKCALEKEFQDREDERLLYVAATRARDALIVSFRRNSKGEVGGPWKRFDAWARQTLPEAAAPADATPAPRVAASELQTFRARRAERLARSSKPTISAASVTALVHASLPSADAATRPFIPGTGRGMSWGSALHRLLEAAMRDPNVDLRALAKNVLAEEDRPPEDLEAAVATVEGVRRSALWKRALASKNCLVEVPFSLSVPSSDLGFAGDTPPETLLSGAIDLVFEESDGWTLVDYKSDTVAGNLDALVVFYKPQIEHYRRVWSDLTGQPTRAGLFFIDGAREVWLPERLTKR
ncbi:MAG: UvrD-helicase domain-containing protein [Acidobacteriota bacterium]|nr:UvrD-helicase domain-containing protein [Acidobacteriota bacterium]